MDEAKQLVEVRARRPRGGNGGEAMRGGELGRRLAFEANRAIMQARGEETRKENGGGTTARP